MGKKLLIGFLVITLVFSNSLVSLAGEEENTIETSDLEENGNMVEVDDSLGTSDILEDNDESNITEVSENISQVEIDEKLSNIKYNEKKEKILDENEAENVLNDSQKEEDTNGQSNVIWNGDNNTEWEGKGTSDSPYLIKCAEDLAGISYKSKNNSESFEGVYFQSMLTT